MEAVLEFLRLYLPTITATITTVIIPMLMKSLWNKVVNKKLLDIERKLSQSIDESNIKDIREDIAAIRDELSTMRGKPPVRGNK